MKARLSTIILSLGILSGCAVAPAWEQQVQNRIPLYGHRNWIVIADSAYPAQSRDGIETIVTGSDQIAVVSTVLKDLAASKHVKPIVYTDQELASVNEQDAPGIGQYRTDLKALLADRNVQVIPHEQVIAKLDEAGKTFRVLIVKTNMTLPYTSVFLQLDCAYWNAEAEKRLRAALAGH